MVMELHEQHLRKQIAAATNRPPVTVASGATTAELCERFALNRYTAYKHFAPALLVAGDCETPNVYSRARVAALLAEWSGRSVGYPTERLLTTREVAPLLGVRADHVCWLRNRGKRHQGPPFVRIGPHFVRYVPDEVYEFLERGAS